MCPNWRLGVHPQGMCPYFCSDLYSVRGRVNLPFTQDEGPCVLRLLSQLVPDCTSSVCDTLTFSIPLQFSLHHLLPRSLVIISLPSHYFARKHGIAPQSDIQEPLHLSHPYMPIQSNFSLLFQNALYFLDCLLLHCPFLCLSKFIPLFKVQFQ